MQHEVTFYSWGHRLAGTLHIPDDYQPAEQRPAIVMAHGMANNRNEAEQHTFMGGDLERAGYVVLRFDFRGCGLSDAPRGRMLIGTEWPQDLHSAITYVSLRTEVDAGRIGVIGSSAGGGVAVYTAAIDRRIKCAVTLGAPANGKRWLHHQWVTHYGDASWQAFLTRIAEDQIRRVQEQPSELVRLIGGFIPVQPDQLPSMEAFLAAHPYIVADMPLEVADDVLYFAPEERAARVSPTPLCIFHGTADLLVDVQEAKILYESACEPKELHLIENGIHQLLIGDSAGSISDTILAWLGRHLA